jgi:beta-glucosidase
MSVVEIREKYMRDRTWAREKAEELVSKMTLEEKASQLVFKAPEIARLGIPAYNWWNEALHGVARAGVATSFPQAIGLAAMFDDDSMLTIGEIVSTEGRAKYNEAITFGDRDIYKGLTFWSPNVNIFRDPRWGRGHETYGEDPFLTSHLGVSFVKGLQGNQPILRSAACAKHYAVHSGPEALRHSFDAVVSKKEMEETYLPAFRALVQEADVEAVMGAYNRTNGEPCCGSKTLIQDILREKWGFEGHFVSDCWAIRDFHQNHKVTSNPRESVLMALSAGCDLNCGCTYEHVMAAYGEGLVDGNLITQAAIRLFTTRYLLGLFDGSEYDQIGYEVIECKKHVDFAVSCAAKSVVLLKNDGTLPLSTEKITSIGVIGPNANSRQALIGNYHGTSSRYITVLEGIQDYLSDTKIPVHYSEGCHLYKDKVEDLGKPGDRLAEACSVANHSDVVILCLGLDETLEGEEPDTGNSYVAGDKRDLKFPGMQEQLLKTVLDCGKPTVVVVLSGSSLDLAYADSHANALLQAWYPGARGGKAIADLLFGKLSPSGKLPVTFYRDSETLPDFTDYSMKNRTYRFMEDEALFPFGFGLTYSDVRVKTLKLVSPASLGCDIEIAVTVENEGLVATEDVIEVYVKDLESKLAVRNYSLCGFKRVSLAPGERLTQSFTIPKASFEVVDNEGERILDSTDFRLYAGLCQPDRRSMELTRSNSMAIDIALRKTER